jgi:streptogramin lyase
MSSISGGHTVQSGRLRLVVSSLLGVLLLGMAASVAVTVVSGAKWALSQTSSEGGYLELNSPTYPAVDTYGNLYVADHSNQRVVKLSSTGTLLGSWHSFTGFAGADNGPGPIALDSQNNVYVASAGKLQKFSPAGSRLAVWSLGFDPQGMAIDTQGNIYVSDSYTGHVLVFTSTATRLAVWKTKGSSPEGLAVGPQNIIYVADRGSDRIEKRSSTGKLLALWGKRGQALGQFNSPDGVAVDGSGSVYVTDSGNHRIQMLSRQGKVLGWWGSWGTSRGQFSRVTSLFVAVDRQHAVVYVTDAAGKAIHKFSWDGKELAMWH